MVNEHQIKELAYTIWVDEGCPEGKDIEHYFRGKKMLEEQEALKTNELAALSPESKLPLQPASIQPVQQVGEVKPGQYKYRRHTGR